MAGIKLGDAMQQTVYAKVRTGNEWGAKSICQQVGRLSVCWYNEQLRYMKSEVSDGPLI